MTTPDTITTYLAARFGAPVQSLTQTTDTGALARYPFVVDGVRYVLTVARASGFVSRETLIARARFAQLAGERGIAPTIEEIDITPAGLPADHIAYWRRDPAVETVAEADLAADPKPLVRLLRRLHSLGVNTAFEALKPPEVDHPQLKGLEPITPHSALAWYLVQYSHEYPVAGKMAEILAGLWVELAQAFGQAGFEYNLPVVTHNRLTVADLTGTAEGDLQLLDFDAALIDDPIIDFVWPLSLFDETGQRHFLDAYGLPDYIHADWRSHWRLRRTHRWLEHATDAAYQAFAGLTDRGIAGFPRRPLAFEAAHTACYDHLNRAAAALDLPPIQPEPWVE